MDRFVQLSWEFCCDRSHHSSSFCYAESVLTTSRYVILLMPGFTIQVKAAMGDRNVSSILRSCYDLLMF